MNKETERDRSAEQLFDRHAAAYDQELRESLGLLSGCSENRFFDKHKARCINRWLVGKVNYSKILDFGCGTGGVMQEVATAFPTATVTGFDVSSEISAVARKRLSGLGNVTWTDDPVARGPYDLVIVANVMHHIDPLKRTGILRQLRECLAENGSLVVFEHNPLNPLTRRIVRNCAFDEDAELVNPSAMAKQAASAGLSRSSLRYVLYLPWKGLLPDMMENVFGRLPFGAQYMAVFDRDNRGKGVCHA